MEKLLLTAEEAGERLSLSRSKVYELMAEGLLESVRVGRSRRVPVQALPPFVEALRRDADHVQQPTGRMEPRCSPTPPVDLAPKDLNECADETRDSVKGSGE
jgi:excisionase family DNA binding protein